MNLFIESNKKSHQKNDLDNRVNIENTFDYIEIKKIIPLKPKGGGLEIWE